MGTPRAVQAVFDAACACDEANPNVQADMFGQLAQSQETEAVSALIAGLKHRKAEVRRRCAWTLGGSDDSRVPGALKEATGDPDELVRRWAASALSYVRSRQSATQPASSGSKGER